MGEEREDFGAPVSQFKRIPQITIIATVPSGQIRTEDGADGTWMLFDCDCLDALPICRAQCCALKGTFVFEEDAIHESLLEWDGSSEEFVMKRDADGRCHCLNRETKTCEIYESRPLVCKQFHCTRGAGMRGWKLANSVARQSMM